MRKIIAAMVLAAACAAAQPGAAEPSPSALAGAWAGEEQYWTRNNAGDPAAYLALFDDAFTGWSCRKGLPETKADLAARAAGLVKPAGARISLSLEDKAATGTGDVVVVYYRARVLQHADDGKVELQVRNFTHTWVRRPDGWRIIGGMCREDVPGK